MVDTQTASEKKRSCEDHIFSLNCIMKHNNNVPALPLKAFDYVNREKLLLNCVDGPLNLAMKVDIV